jgi:hypothetical protein
MSNTFNVNVLNHGAIIQPSIIPAVPKPVPALCSLPDNRVVVIPVAGSVIVKLPNSELKYPAPYTCQKSAKARELKSIPV